MRGVGAPVVPVSPAVAVAVGPVEGALDLGGGPGFSPGRLAATVIEPLGDGPQAQGRLELLPGVDEPADDLRRAVGPGAPRGGGADRAQSARIGGDVAALRQGGTQFPG